MEAEKLNKMLQGWRKAGYWFVSLLAMTGGAWHMKATFTEYRDGVIVLASLILAGHLYQQVKGGGEIK